MAKKVKTFDPEQGGGDEVFAGDSRKNRRDKGQTNAEFWSSDFGQIPNSDLDRILEIPGIDDFAGILARGNFKNDQERIAYLRLVRRLRKFNLESRLEFIRECIGSTLGRMAFGKMLQLQSKVELIVPAVIRDQLAMKQVKGKEERSKGSDFREEQEQDPAKG